jgi:hypothetical protein
MPRVGYCHVPVNAGRRRGSSKQQKKEEGRRRKKEEGRRKKKEEEQKPCAEDSVAIAIAIAISVSETLSSETFSCLPPPPWQSLLLSKRSLVLSPALHPQP